MRGKQFLYDEGIKIPLIIKWPEVTQAGSRRKDLVSQIDISATSLYLAGIPVPNLMQGQPLYGEDYCPREYIYSARDRCDETVDLIRAVRTNKFKYIRNFLPHKPHTQPNSYKDEKEVIKHMRQLFTEDKLKKETVRYFEPFRPAEELYDLENDPWEINNLARDQVYQGTLTKMQNILSTALFETKDLGFIPEPVLEDLGKQYKNKYYILHHEENQNLTRKCIEVMEFDQQRDVESLIGALSDENEAIRFWAAYGLGNIPDLSIDVVNKLQRILNNDTEAVKIAAARAICRLKESKAALNVLEDNLQNSNLIVGLYAALFIEDLDEDLIIKALPAIKEVKESPYEFTSRTARRLSDNLQR